MADICFAVPQCLLIIQLMVLTCRHILVDISWAMNEGKSGQQSIHRKLYIKIYCRLSWQNL